MVKVIYGLKGTGKTKQIVDLVNAATAQEAGSVICIERGRKLTYDIKHSARLIDTAEYDVRSFQVLRGFITGLYAGNYDISHIFIDSLQKVAHNDDMAEIEKFLGWVETFGKANGVSFTITISFPEGVTPTEGIQKYA